jgi:squalene synthase HpnC
MPPASPAANAPASITHYENFPVASWLCPPRLRAPIAAIYHFARTADDLADEGDHCAEQRLAQLQQYAADLQQLGSAGEAAMLMRTAWPHIFGPLAVQVQAHGLPKPLLADLLSAFEQDVRMTAAQTRYTDMAQLLDYCRRSANPVGRLLLHLYGVVNAKALIQSDAICTALQLINFWQDLSQDLPRQRHYLPDADLARHGLVRSAIKPEAAALTPELRSARRAQPPGPQPDDPWGASGASATRPHGLGTAPGRARRSAHSGQTGRHAGAQPLSAHQAGKLDMVAMLWQAVRM